MFQFQSGSIKREFAPIRFGCSVHKSFNSNLVLLKVYNARPFARVCPFQFQSGSIKSFILEVFILLFARFNSNLVLLKAGLLSRVQAAVSAFLFQFQSGSIKSRLEIIADHREVGFQFQSGSIKRKDNPPQPRCWGRVVSIPIWFY